MNNERGDSQEYLNKKKLFDGMLTVYGRKPLLEALQDKATQIYRLHLADSNKSADILDEIIALAKAKGAQFRRLFMTSSRKLMGGTSSYAIA